jgi:hypothetical protein
MVEHAPWEYRVETVKNPDVKELRSVLNRIGSEGWELVSMTTTVKTWINVTGNDLVFVFKRPGLGEYTPEKEWYQHAGMCVHAAHIRHTSRRCRGRSDHRALTRPLATSMHDGGRQAAQTCRPRRSRSGYPPL